MATMKRNTNLEEINTDALFGISYLKYQTKTQKLVMFGSVVVGIVINIMSSFMFDINPNIASLFMMIPIFIGVLLGCNYNQDLSLISYIRLSVSNPSKTYYSKSFEDLENIRRSAEQIKKNKQIEQRESISEEEHLKSLIRLIVIVVLMVIGFIAIVVVIKISKTEEIHHTVSYVANLRALAV